MRKITPPPDAQLLLKQLCKLFNGLENPLAQAAGTAADDGGAPYFIKKLNMRGGAGGEQDQEGQQTTEKKALSDEIAQLCSAFGWGRRRIG